MISPIRSPPPPHALLPPAQADRTFRAVLERYPKAPKVLRAFAAFLEEARNPFTGLHLPERKGLDERLRLSADSAGPAVVVVTCCWLPSSGSPALSLLRSATIPGLPSATTTRRPSLRRRRRRRGRTRAAFGSTTRPTPWPSFLPPGRSRWSTSASWRCLGTSGRSSWSERMRAPHRPPHPHRSPFDNLSPPLINNSGRLPCGCSEPAATCLRLLRPRCAGPFVSLAA